MASRGTPAPDPTPPMGNTKLMVNYATLTAEIKPKDYIAGATEYHVGPTPLFGKEGPDVFSAIVWKHLQLPLHDADVVPPSGCAENGFMYVGAEYCNLPSGPKKRRRPNRNNRSKKKKKNKGATLAADDAEVNAALDDASAAEGSGTVGETTDTKQQVSAEPPTNKTPNATATQHTPPSTEALTQPNAVSPPSTPAMPTPAPSTVVPSPPSGTELNIPTFFDFFNGLINSLPCGNLITRHKRRELAATAVGLSSASITVPSETAPLRPKEVFRPVPLSSDPRPGAPTTPRRVVSPPPKSTRTSVSSARPIAAESEDQPGPVVADSTPNPGVPTALTEHTSSVEALDTPAVGTMNTLPPTLSSSSHDNSDGIDRDPSTTSTQEYIIRDEIIILSGNKIRPHGAAPTTAIAASPAPSPVASPMVSTPVRVPSFESLDEVIVFPMIVNGRPKPEQTCFCETCCNPPDRYARLDDTDLEEDEEEEEVDATLQWQLV
ncbi:uncharacterized protein LOC62_07G009471 [Vanrija pseudolonga]|uniref:Uncharacterized protein n=1 Tax=Vanrija pseudolonga TaxID=143232 RepID=A0AAF0YG50_9TREE|nr:hypothetical protein LOC62_07G009471 [Vanrija pseudolonga]